MTHRLHSLFQDFWLSVRQLSKSPGLTILAILTLALGIGANTAMFTVADNVLLRPLPYPEASRLVSVSTSDREQNPTTSWLNYRDVRDQSQTLDAVSGYSTDLGVLQADDGASGVLAPRVTPNLLRMLGARPLLGRVFADREGQAGGAQVAMLSEGLWREKFHADPEIVGRTIRLNEKPQTVIGVLPSSFRFPEATTQGTDTAVWLPIQPTEEMLKDRGYDFFQILGQLKPGVTLAQARTEARLIAGRIHRAAPDDTEGLALYVEPYQETITGPIRAVFVGLIAALGLVLLIACANVANLLIARCLVRQQEFAVRAALGASRWRLARQMIIEGGVLSTLGCAAGFALACLAIGAVHRLPPDAVPLADRIGVRWTVMLILGGIATITTVFSAIVPAFMVARADPQKALQAASRGLGSRSVRGRISGTLVGVEVALSTLLLVATGLLTHTLWNLEHANLGLDTTHVTTFTAMPGDAAGFTGLAVSTATQTAPTSVATLVYEPVLDRIERLPGVMGAALATTPPLSGSNMSTSFDLVGEPKDRQHHPVARITAVSTRYASVLGTPVLRGRMISDADSASAPYVAVINDALARKYFPTKDPLGRQLDLGGKETGMLRPYTVVGVLGDQIAGGVSQPVGPLIMLTYEQVPTTSLYYPLLLKTVMSFAVKTRGDIAVASGVRSVFHQAAPDYAVEDFAPMQQAVDKSNFSARLGMYLIGAFGVLATALVIAGLYGVLAQLVSYRRREIGVRLALGATPREIVRLILRQGLVVIGIGLAAGILAAVLTERLVTGFLYEVQPLDAWTYAGVVLVLLCAGSIAALVPARRASSVGPVEALREE
ncbi:MAG TPA: ABC transporter permease [Candidatus Cybelea sp.]|nr:ABC transporter permease [Candidatus Cybelea sp.]